MLLWICGYPDPDPSCPELGSVQKQNSTTHKYMVQMGNTAGHRGPWEIFYSCPAASAPEFFNALVSLVPNTEEDCGGELTSQLGRLCMLAAIAQVCSSFVAVSSCRQRNVPVACSPACLLSSMWHTVLQMAGLMTFLELYAWSI